MVHRKEHDKKNTRIIKPVRTDKVVSLGVQTDNIKITEMVNN